MDQTYHSALAWALLRHEAQDRRLESIRGFINQYLDDHQTIKEATQSIGNPHQRVFVSALTLLTINLLSLDFLRQVGAYTQLQFDEQVAFWREVHDAYEASGNHYTFPESFPTEDEVLENLTCRWALGVTAEQVVADLGDSAPAMRRRVLLLANQWQFDWLNELGLTKAQVEEMQAHMPRMLQFYEEYLQPAMIS